MVGGCSRSIAGALHMMLSLSSSSSSSRLGGALALGRHPRSLTRSGDDSSRLFLTGALDAQTTTSSCQYFLMKSEPDEFSIQDLEKCQEQEWDGIRSFQARP